MSYHPGHQIVNTNLSGYPAYFDELPDEPVSCYNCDNDCPGVILEVFKENSFEHETHVQYLISSILVDQKHYYMANTTTHLGMKCLKMYYVEGEKFARNMAKFGYKVILIRDSFKRYSAFVFINDENDDRVDPEELIHIFRALEVIK